MIKDTKLRKDIQEIMKIGTDGKIYIEVATFINSLEPTATNTIEFKRQIHVLANLIRLLEKQ